MEQAQIKKILNETEQGYDLISNKFSQTRKHFWRGLEFIADYAKKGDNVLDFGCGNGRLLELIGNIENLQYFGLDISQKLVDVASQRYQDRTFQKINPLQITLPFTDDYFNTVYSIAVFHHFPGKEYREDLAKELYRLTKKEGRIVITVWNLWQKRYIGNIIRNWFNKLKGKSDLDWNDCYISFTDNVGNKFQRFHHAFTKREIEGLFSKAGFEIEKCEIINGRNIVLLVKK
jgi:alkylated DNA repair protein alkB homolog 8